LTFQATPEQKAIIDLDEGCFLVEAPPGSGKTQVLTERVRRLLLTSPSTENFRVLALTFTTKAAETLRSRVAETLNDSAAKRVNADTFHGFALSMLRSYGDRVAFPSSPTIYERQSDRRDALARGIEEEGFGPRSPKDLDGILKDISAHKRALQLPEDLDDPELALFYRAYQRVLSDCAACDFDDLLLLAWRLLSEHPRVADHYRRLYRYILVDEAQDTSRVQYEILKALCTDKHRSVMLVADKSQGIYGFAGATPEFLDAFVVDFTAQRLPLTQNFRSARVIVQLANELVAHDDRLRKPAQDVVGATGYVSACVRPTEAAEADLVVRCVQRLLDGGLKPEWLVDGERASLDPEDIAILGRSRYCLSSVLADLPKAGVPHFFSAGEAGLFESPTVRLLVDGLRLVNNPNDQVTMRALAKAWRVANAKSPAELLAVIGVDGRAAPIVALLTRMLGTSPPFDVNPFMLEAIALVKAMAAKAETATDASVIDEAARLATDANTFDERWSQYRGPLAPMQRSVGGFLGSLALSGRSVVRGAGVRVLTIHAAKGLEFRAVFVVGMNEGTLPDFRCLDEGGIKEERRSTYVAITRAGRFLMLTRPASRETPWGAIQQLVESRFIKEMKLVMA
jgi:DNA helicase-2/ATP-dependent DNA helicase PcrA